MMEVVTGLSLAGAAAMLLGGNVLRIRQRRADAAAPIVPCDRCGAATPLTALTSYRSQDGTSIDVCDRCWSV